MGREVAVVERHLRHWRERGLIDGALENRLRESSRELDQSATGGALRTALALLGGTLVLGGLLLIVAENWTALSHGFKLVAWAILLVGFLAASYDLGRRFPERPALAEALALVAGGWVLAGIVLMSQIYHLDIRPANGAWMWAILVAPGAWLLPRRATAAVLFVALVTALGLEVAAADSWIHSPRADSPWLWLAIPLLAATLVSTLPRPLPALRAWVGFWTFAAGQTFLLVLGVFHKLDRSELGPAWVLVAAGLAAAVVWPQRALPAAWGTWTARLAVALTLLPWALLGAQYDAGVDDLVIVAAWVLQLAVAALLIRAGAQAGSRAWINLGYAALLAGVVVRYFDLFGNRLQGGAALALTGCVLLFILFAIEMARRRTLAVRATS